MHILITFDYKTHYQVQAMERKIKHKLRPQNAFGLAKDLDVPASCPREELHQFLIGVYGEYILPSYDAICFSHQNACFSHPCFYMPFLTMKMTI